MLEVDDNAPWRRTSFFLSCQNLLSRKALQSRRVHTLAAGMHFKIMFDCLFSRKRHLLFTRSSIVYTYISAYCKNRITTSHAPASTTAFRILIICNGKWPVVNPSAPRFQRLVLTSQQVTLVGCIPETSVVADFVCGLMYYLGPAQVARQQTHGELNQEVQDFHRKEEIQDQMPHLTPSLLIKNLTAKAGHLGRQLGGGVCRGGNDFENTVAPAAKQLQQSWDPEAFREAGLRLPVLFVGMRIICGSFHCNPNSICSWSSPTKE